MRPLILVQIAVGNGHAKPPSGKQARGGHTPDLPLDMSDNNIRAHARAESADLDAESLRNKLLLLTSKLHAEV